MNEQSDGNTNDPAIAGELVVRRRIFLSRKIPVTVTAKHNGVKFTVYRQQYRSRYVPYQDLRSVSSREIFGQKRIDLYADVGVETINCHSSDFRISEFCNFVNDKIAHTRRKPLAAKFALTRTEVPPEKNYTTWVYDEYGSAIDVLFNQEGSVDDLLEKLESEIASLTTKKERIEGSRRKSRSATPEHNRSDDDYQLFRNGYSFLRNIDPNKIRPGRILLGGTAITAALFTLAWLADKRPITPISPESDLSLAKSALSNDKAIETIPEEAGEETASRSLLHLITLMQDDTRYNQLITRLKQKREALKIDGAALSAQMGWDIARLENIEAQLIRATPMDIVKLSIHIDEDFHDIIGFEK
ncbi:hypothetical protein EET67_15580 [Pseudaminobacter arsenicus]|uniref:Uncharacterized protein n=1 Tax=Borborobacter arsenicus TaxID=1851146 RepID=A0A432V465_9HYPH|nr:hypothetical protein [Pseudaminobacter arsenicus]RUM96956.1 hypothetical protein EET67_15580 [Pseudaminobacter arsenicus]